MLSCVLDYLNLQLLSSSEKGKPLKKSARLKGPQQFYKCASYQRSALPPWIQTGIFYRVRSRTMPCAILFWLILQNCVYVFFLLFSIFLLQLSKFVLLLTTSFFHFPDLISGCSYLSFVFSFSPILLSLHTSPYISHCISKYQTRVLLGHYTISNRDRFGLPLLSVLSIYWIH